MIEARELRIGNFVTDKHLKGLIVVESINEDGINYSLDNGLEFCDLMPIPLTEEWLLRLGFSRWNGYLIADAFSPGHPSQRFDLYWSRQDGFMTKSRYQEDIPETFYMRHTRYVHNLQNLFQALTGQELEINEQRKEQP